MHTNLEFLHKFSYAKSPDSVQLHASRRTLRRQWEIFATVQNVPTNDGDKKTRNIPASAVKVRVYDLLHATLIQTAAVYEAESYPQPD
jgi:hypothetical protein